MTKPQDDPQPSGHRATAPARAQPTPPRDAPAQATWKRRDSGVLDQSLQSFTEMWLKGIPENVRPPSTIRAY
jgi:hypothetical protein